MKKKELQIQRTTTGNKKFIAKVTDVTTFT